MNGYNKFCSTQKSEQEQTNEHIQFMYPANRVEKWAKDNLEVRKIERTTTSFDTYSLSYLF